MIKNIFKVTLLPPKNVRENVCIGFTLAEVLITLSILGVIAAVAIPSTISHFKKQYVISRLKIAYSTLVTATEIAEAHVGINSDDWNYRTNTPQNRIKSYLLPNLNIAHDCQTQGGLCLGDKDGIYTKINLGNGNYTQLYYSGYNGIILKNGISMAFDQCSYGGCPVWIDIDGPNKGPNTLNKDIFSVYYTEAEYVNGQKVTQNQNPRFSKYTTEYQIRKYGLSECTISNGPDRTHCINLKSWCNNNRDTACLGYIIYSGWKIPHDYPVKF